MGPQSLLLSPSRATLEDHPRPTWAPALDVFRTATGWIVRCALPGVAPEDTAVALVGDVLTISGVRRAAPVDSARVPFRIELWECRFERRVRLPRIGPFPEVQRSLVGGVLELKIIQAAA
jgi:HSP20 family molecular chaperone IbpA